eukprot:gene5568-6130_t
MTCGVYVTLLWLWTFLVRLCRGEKSDNWHSSMDYKLFPSTKYVPCLQDEETEQLVHTNGTRLRLFIFYHDDHTFSIVNRFAHCKDWITPFKMERSPFMESQVYRRLFLPSIANLTQEVDFVMTCTYRHVLRSMAADGHITTALSFQRIRHILEQVTAEKFDVIPLETLPRAFITYSLFSYHGINSIKAWNVLLVRMGFSLAAMDSAQHIYGFWRSSYLIRPPVLHGLTLLMVEAMDRVEKDNECRRFFVKDARYTGTNSTVAQLVFGTPYYQMHPFIFERLPAFFLTIYNASMPNMVSKAYRRPAEIRISDNKTSLSF